MSHYILQLIIYKNVKMYEKIREKVNNFIMIKTSLQKVISNKISIFIITESYKFILKIYKIIVTESCK